MGVADHAHACAFSTSRVTRSRYRHPTTRRNRRRCGGKTGSPQTGRYRVATALPRRWSIGSRGQTVLRGLVASRKTPGVFAALRRGVRRIQRERHSHRRGSPRARPSCCGHAAPIYWRSSEHDAVLLWRKLEFAGLTGRRQWWRNLSRRQRRGGFDVTSPAVCCACRPIAQHRAPGAVGRIPYFDANIVVSPGRLLAYHATRVRHLWRRQQTVPRIMGPPGLEPRLPASARVTPPVVASGKASAPT
jgi:hypothetical protein